MSDAKEGLLEETRGDVKRQSLSSRLSVAHGDRKVMEVSLGEDRVSFHTDASGYRDIKFADVIGIRRDGPYAFVLHSYPVVVTCWSAKRQHTESRLESDSKETVDLWMSHVRARVWNPRQALSSRSSSRLLVLVNPASGSGKAKRVWHDLCMPVFLHSDAQFDVVETQYAGHANDVVQSVTFSAGEKEAADGKHEEKKQSVVYSGVVVVSGDGLMNEVVNGVMKRADWKSVLEHVAFGHIPAGSGNGLAKSISTWSREADDPISMSFLICRQQTRQLDLFSTKIANQPPNFGFLQFSHGLISDIDFESEKLRCIGGARFTVWALYRLMALRKYHGTLRIQTGGALFEGEDDEVSSSQPLQHHLQQPNYSSIVESSASFTKCKPVEECHQCTQSGANGLEDLQAFLNATETKEQQTSSSSSSSSSLDATGEWETVEGPFVMMCATNVPFVASDTCMAPYAHCSDGLLDLVYVTGAQGKKCSLLNAFLNIEDGSHMKTSSDVFTYRKCRALRFTPGTSVDDLTQRSKLNIDGEIAPDAETEIRIFQGVMTAFSY